MRHEDLTPRFQRHYNDHPIYASPSTEVFPDVEDMKSKQIGEKHDDAPRDVQEEAGVVDLIVTPLSPFFFLLLSRRSPV